MHSKIFRTLAILTISFIYHINSFAQFVPINTTSAGIYEFIDELGNCGIINLSSAVKPYGREQVAQYLVEAEAKKSELNGRQQKDLKFFLNEFALELNKLPDNTHLNIVKNKRTVLSLLDPSFRYRDSLVAIKFSPILGMHILQNDKGKVTQRWYGAEFFVTRGKHLSFYASLRDFSNYGEILADGERKIKIRNPFTQRDTLVTQYGQISQQQGGAYKRFSDRADYSEMRGGVYYTWDWGHVGIAKDYIIFGDNYHGSNILSGRTPSFPMVKLYLKPTKFLTFSWFHGWLTSNVIDSSNFYQDNTGKKLYRYYNKYISSNMFTITPFKNFNFSFGNSIVYAEKNINAGYLVPFLFYKSVDHSLTMGTENQNSQLFFNLSSRNIPHLHLYSSVFFDEIKWSRFSSSNKENNPVSYKVGGRLSDWPIRNVSATIEYTKNAIATYNHSIPALTYSSGGYNLGSYLGDNAKEIYASLSFKPLRGLYLEASYTDAKHGNQYSYIRSDILEIISQPFMKDVVWSNTTYSFNIQYEIVSNAFAVINIDLSDIRGFDSVSEAINGEYFTSAQQYLDMYTPKFLQGKNTTITFGFSFGF